MRWIGLLFVLLLSLPGWAGEWQPKRLEPGTAAVYEWDSVDDSEILNATRCGSVLWSYLDDVTGADTAASANVVACKASDTPIGSCDVEAIFTSDIPGQITTRGFGLYRVDVTAAPSSGKARISAYCSEQVSSAVCPVVGSDFTLDPDVLGTWLLTTDNTQASAETDRAPANGSDDMTFNAAGVYAVEAPPAGSGNGQRAVDLFADPDNHFTLADDDAFEAADFTAGCWVFVENSANFRVVISKNDVSAWEIGYATDHFQGEVGNAVSAATTTPLNEWVWVALRYDDTGSSPDAADDEIEIFLNGMLACDGGCATGGARAGNADPLSIGVTQAPPTGQMQGQMMECFYADRVLSDEEMAEVFLCGIDGQADGESRDAAFSGATCDAISSCC